MIFQNRCCLTVGVWITDSLQLHAVARNLGNFMPMPAMPKGHGAFQRLGQSTD
jgi:hypothetical protein